MVQWVCEKVSVRVSPSAHALNNSSSPPSGYSLPSPPPTPPLNSSSSSSTPGGLSALPSSPSLQDHPVPAWGCLGQYCATRMQPRVYQVAAPGHPGRTWHTQGTRGCLGHPGDPGQSWAILGHPDQHRGCPGATLGLLRRSTGLPGLSLCYAGVAPGATPGLPQRQFWRHTAVTPESILAPHRCHHRRRTDATPVQFQGLPRGHAGATIGAAPGQPLGHTRPQGPFGSPGQSQAVPGPLWATRGLLQNTQ